MSKRDMADASSLSSVINMREREEYSCRNYTLSQILGVTRSNVKFVRAVEGKICQMNFFFFFFFVIVFIGSKKVNLCLT